MQTPVIRTLWQTEAIEAIEAIKDIEDDQQVIIQGWALNNHMCCHQLLVDDQVVSFLLVSKCDFDPFYTDWDPKTHQLSYTPQPHHRDVGVYEDPWTLDLIYTLASHRRKQYAFQLLTHFRDTHQWTAFVSNHASEQLFRKASYRCAGMDLLTRTFPIYRSQ